MCPALAVLPPFRPLSEAPLPFPCVSCPYPSAAPFDVSFHPYRWCRRDGCHARGWHLVHQALRLPDSCTVRPSCTSLCFRLCVLMVLSSLTHFEVLFELSKSSAMPAVVENATINLLSTWSLFSVGLCFNVRAAPLIHCGSSRVTWFFSQQFLFVCSGYALGTLVLFP